MNIVRNYCRPLTTVSLLRHGIRYASSKDMERASSLVDRFQHCMRDKETIEGLRYSLAVLATGKEKQLSETGAAEQRNIGKRLRRKVLSKIFLC